MLFLNVTTENGRPRRLTQPERSAATRQALLDSTIECLIEFGYDKATTDQISERVGLSRGAHLHHFQTRATLIVAATGELAKRIAADLGDRIDQLPEGTGRRGAALDTIWEVFTGPLFQAVLELAIHARTEPQLQRQFGLLEQVVRHGSGRLLRQVFGRDLADHRFDDMIALVVSTIRGLAILPILDPSYSPEKRWGFCRTSLLSLMQDDPDGVGAIAAPQGNGGSK
ncbi:MAG: TetR/AcrR family transcriptional regulator [Acidimicrobiales bacterium]